MPNRIIEFIKKHVRDHLAIYFFVFFCFLIGISVGAFTVKAVDGHQKLELVTYLRGFFQLFDHNSPKGFDIFKQSINNNLQLLFLNWLMGILIVGLPFIFFNYRLQGLCNGLYRWPSDRRIQAPGNITVSFCGTASPDSDNTSLSFYCRLFSQLFP